MRLPFTHSRSGASPAAQLPPHAPTKPSTSLKTIIFLASALCTLIPSVTAQAKSKPNLTIAFHDEGGAVTGSPVTLPYDECTYLDTSSLNGQNYFSANTTDLRAALNLYSDPQCQVPANSAVGSWPYAGLNDVILAVRYEGAAPADRATGVLSNDSFPARMNAQQYNPVDDDGTSKAVTWVLDATKGRIVVGVVSAVMVIGVAIGIYQVYVAAQYKPPPKKPKNPKTGLNIKKIKKKDAYYKKPVRPTEDQAAFQRLHNSDSPEPSAAGGYHQPAMAMTERSRDSQYSEAATYVDWNNQSSQMKSSPLNSSRKGYQDGSDSVSIDMRDALGGNNNNNNNNNTRSSPFANSFSADLMHFDGANGRGGGGYGQQQQTQNQSYRGRGGEVLVPMDTLDSHHHHNQYNNNGRSAVRRTSSSRSR